ncbi:hypothetical protein NDU88_004593 [Pleurodeles waltl]|uniref:Uncharacterized protein n=1 Tax=Pleurodeles waltl TaxID=8319 RepID=A0AAV7WSS4_PLEWA|nr:hypothetical protein NDU88_004593 [Pleurodeles waltl]
MEAFHSRFLLFFCSVIIAVKCVVVDALVVAFATVHVSAVNTFSLLADVIAPVIAVMMAAVVTALVPAVITAVIAVVRNAVLTGLFAGVVLIMVLDTAAVIHLVEIIGAVVTVAYTVVAALM